MQIKSTSQNFGIKNVKSIKNITNERIIKIERLREKRKGRSRISFSQDFLEKMQCDAEVQKSVAQEVFNKIKLFIEKKQKGI